MFIAYDSFYIEQAAACDLIFKINLIILNPSFCKYNFKCFNLGVCCFVFVVTDGVYFCEVLIINFKLNFF